MKVETPGAGCRFYASDSAYGNASHSGIVYDTDGWKRGSATYTVQADGAVRIVFSSVSASATMYIDAVQMEVAYLSPYIDGSLSDGPGLVAGGHAWTGTAHASSSTRSSGSLSYPIANNIQAERGTFMCWVYVEANNSLGACAIFDAGSAWPNFAFYMSNGTTPTFIWGASTNFAQGPAAAVGQWVHVAVTWDMYAGEAVVYTNGVAGTLKTNFPTTKASLGTNMGVGYMQTLGGQRLLNGYLDDFVFLDRVSPPDEVLAVYESDAPVFAESSVFVLRSTPTGLVWADERGLWMRDANGEEVMGMYGGEAATYSWGGKSLEKGDILFGRYGVSDGGWFFWDRNGVSSLPFLSLGYADKEVMAFDAGGASLTGVLDISANGGIYQGTGTFASPTTGLKMFNSGGIGKISGYNTSVEQWTADTDGKIKAGAGIVIIDANGISITPTTTYTTQRAYKFVNGANVVGGIQNYSGGAGPYAYTKVFSDTPAGAGHVSQVRLEANHSGSGSYFVIANDGAATSGQMAVGTFETLLDTGTFRISAYLSTGAFPTLKLHQADASEEFIEFESNVGAGQPVDTAALGTYYGKIRVSVNGTFKYVGLYNT